MAELDDFEANGVEFPEAPGPDVSELINRIPNLGTLHVGVLQQPYFDLIAAGIKTIESRFNTKRAAPYGRVAVGDLVLLKEPGKPISSYFFASGVDYYDLAYTSLATVREQYAAGICAKPEEEFWQSKVTSRYCSLIEVGERGPVTPLKMIKKDQRGWISFTSPTEVIAVL